MQLFLTFPDSGYPDVLFIATANSIVKEAIESAAEEWGVVAAFLELSLHDNYLPPSSLLVSHGVESDLQLSASLLRWIGKDLLTDASTREEVRKLIKNGRFGSDARIPLNTPTFVGDNGCLVLKKEWIPKGITDLCFENPHPSVTSTSSGFLVGSKVESLNLMGLQHVTSVDYFLKYCEIVSLDLSPVRNITSIGGSFLMGTTRIEELDLSPLSNLTSIGSLFLAHNVSIVTVNLSGLDNLTSIGDDFMCNSGVRKLDFSSLRNVTSIGDGFLFNLSVQSLDLSCMCSISSIGDSFLRSARVSRLTLPPAANLVAVGDFFLAFCSLFSLTLGEGLDDGIMSFAEKKEFYLNCVREPQQRKRC
eukprot:TRINITY_DN22158_c0_g1_i1.p1 TRINITY_DN22158_c0_g1~~TRINITY_DN22158_c0_g1_i1.p1  ORF type:complete len:377 (+),score=56.96 TRINITY_DN22158_c0_g1_i1:48-1133(+)